MRVLTINTGSSSLKAAVFEAGPDGGAVPQTQASQAGLAESAEFDAALKHILAPISGLDAAGHRIVAPGTAWPEPRRVDRTLLHELRKLKSLAPDHLPQALAAIHIVARHWPRLPQWACSDSSFHRTLSPAARALPLPAQWQEPGFERCGYHGLSCESIVQQLQTDDAALASARLIVAHLGNGCSLTAIQQGRSVETTMGFTPLGGLVMSTRSGDLDPGVLAHLMRQRGVTARALDEGLNQASGLLGLSGLSGDMKTLLERQQEPAAALAIEVFVHQARKHLGAMAAVLGGVDGLIFTGGIGEHAAEIRSRITQGLEGWGMQVRVMKTDEDAMIARHTARMAQASGAATQ